MGPLFDVGAVLIKRTVLDWVPVHGNNKFQSGWLILLVPFGSPALVVFVEDGACACWAPMQKAPVPFWLVAVGFRR